MSHTTVAESFERGATWLVAVDRPRVGPTRSKPFFAGTANAESVPLPNPIGRHFQKSLPIARSVPLQRVRVGLCPVIDELPKEKVAMRDSPQRWLAARPSATVIDLARKASAKKFAYKSAKKFAYKEVTCGEISRWCRRRPKKVTLSNTQQRL